MFGEIQNFDRMQRLVLQSVAVNGTTDRANDRTIAERYQSAKVVCNCMFSHSEVLRDVARPIVRR